MGKWILRFISLTLAVMILAACGGTAAPAVAPEKPAGEVHNIYQDPSQGFSYTLGVATDRSYATIHAVAADQPNMSAPGGKSTGTADFYIPQSLIETAEALEGKSLCVRIVNSVHAGHTFDVTELWERPEGGCQ